MALIRWRGKEWDPFRDLLELQQQTNQLFDASLESLPERLSREAQWCPSLDVSEDKENIVLKADLPGVKQSDIDISVTGNLITIKGERKSEEETKEKKMHRVERFYGTFMRSLSLPDYADTSKISAEYKEGVLEVVIPKTEKAKPRQIKVNVK